MATTATAEQPAPEPFKPPPGNPRFPLFDGLRAFAALGVLFGHCAVGTLSRGTFAGHFTGDLIMGVTVFFVISGFLLYRPFVAADMSGREAPVAGVFYWRRVLRIVPGYWFALTMLALLPGVVSVFQHGWGWQYFLLVQNYSGPKTVFQPGIAPAWSLSVEFAFYLVLPLYALMMRRLAGSDPDRRLRRELVVLASLAVVSMAVRMILISQISADQGLASLWIWTPTLTLPLFWTWFAVGMAFASISAWSWRTGKVPSALQALRDRPGAVWLVALGGYLFLVLGWGPLTSGEAEIDHLLTAFIAACLVLPAAFPNAEGRGAPARVLALPALAWVGVISYGIYLWADPITISLHRTAIVDWSNPYLPLVAAVLCLAIGAGAFSYYLIERPFLRLKNRRLGVPRRPQAIPQEAEAHAAST